MNRIRLYLVRHGQTDYNLKHLLQGSGINSSLNQTGQNEAEKLKNTGKLLMKTDMIYSSPLERAVQTGEIVTGLKRDRNSRSKSLAIEYSAEIPKKISKMRSPDTPKLNR